MEPSFWLERWRQNQIGFHQDQFNAHLQEFWDRLGVPPGGRVFTPLCGKSLDMLWLAGRGHSVIGVEISPIAVSSFFSENALPAERTRAGKFEVWKSGEISILRGDFFDLSASDLENVDGVYDRASLIALPPQMRERYAQHLTSTLPPSAAILLVTMEYDQSEMQGPPFAVHEEEVRGLYGGRYNVSVLYTHDALAENPQLAARGVHQMTERVYRLQPANPV